MKKKKQPAHRTSISMPKSLYQAAEQRMADRHYTEFSEYIAALIREDAVTQPFHLTRIINREADLNEVAEPKAKPQGS